MVEPCNDINKYKIENGKERSKNRADWVKSIEEERMRSGL
jgi:hypothetical protein